VAKEAQLAYDVPLLCNEKFHTLQRTQLFISSLLAMSKILSSLYIFLHFPDVQQALIHEFDLKLPLSKSCPQAATSTYPSLYSYLPKYEKES
jgi:hypothetical protein